MKLFIFVSGYNPNINAYDDARSIILAQNENDAIDSIESVWGIGCLRPSLDIIFGPSIMDWTERGIESAIDRIVSEFSSIFVIDQDKVKHAIPWIEDQRAEILDILLRQ
jgi:hypothetical protein